MAHPKILLIDTLHSSFIKNTTKAGFTCVEGYDWGKQKLIHHIDEFAGIAIRSRIKLDKEILSYTNKLKFIARAGAGMENIDVAYAESKKIKCINAPEGNRDAVGEHIIGMLLSLLNNIYRADEEVRNGVWRREENRGIELQGKTIGIIGFGNMGTALAKKLSGFEVSILVYDKYISVDENKFPFVKQVPMNKLLEETDILSLHIPLTDETHYLVDDEFINHFKKNIYVINTSRGRCVSTADLVKNIKTGKVRGALLDVLEYESTSFETLDKQHMPQPFQYLIKSDKVILTPHIAGWTVESNEKIALILVEKIKAFYKFK